MRGKTRFLAVLALLAMGGVVFFGCGSSTDEPNVPQIQPQALEFTPDTLQPAAGIMAFTVDFFNRIAVVFGAIAGKIPAPAGAGPSRLAPVPLGSSGLCLSAVTDMVTWNDVNDDNVANLGDTLTVDLQDCALKADGGFTVVTGTPAVTFTAATDLTAAGFAGVLALNFTTYDAGFPAEPMAIAGLMPATFSAISFPAAEITMGDPTVGAANNQITIMDSAGTTYSFGCFDVKLTFPDATNPFNFDAAVRGVGLIDGVFHLQAGDYAEGTSPGALTFVGGSPESGELKLLSFDSRPTYGLPVCYANVTGTTSAKVTATGGSLIQLDRFDNITWTGPPAESIVTDWSTLLFL